MNLLDGPYCLELVQGCDIGLIIDYNCLYLGMKSRHNSPRELHRIGIRAHDSTKSK